MAATDVISLDEAMTAISMTGPGAQHGEQVSLFVSAVSELLDDLCGPIVIRTVTETIYTSGTSARLSQWPIDSITEITEAGTAVTASEAGGYVAQNGLLVRHSSGLPTYWDGTIVATYEAGRFATTATVAAKFKLAAQEIIAREWPQYASAWSRGGGVFDAPEGGIGFFRSVEPVVSQWLAHERRPPAVA